jgi:hypothetical protein
MKPEDYTKAKNDRSQSTDNKKLIDRREAFNKAGWYALSAATMMVLLKSQPAKAASALPAMPNPPSTSGQEWRRTTRS